MANIRKPIDIQIQEKITGSKTLQAISSTEPESFDLIVDQALNFPSGANRWMGYEALKKQGTLLAGWHAGYDSLTTTGHYESMIDFIDYMLPQSSNEDEVPIHQRYYNPDELSVWQQRAQRILDTKREQRSLPAPTPRTAGFLSMDDLMREMLPWLSSPKTDEEK